MFVPKNAIARDRPLRWGVIGTGLISRQMAADFLLVEGAELAAACSRDSVRAAGFADDFAIPYSFDNLDDLLASDIDAVYIGTPHVTHFAIASAAITAGRHVLVEKPMVMSASQAEQLGRSADAAGVFLMEGMWMKFNPLFAQLSEI